MTATALRAGGARARARSRSTSEAAAATPAPRPAASARQRSLAAPAAPTRPSGRIPTVMLGAAIVGLPVLRPSGPGNSAPVDLLIALAIVTTVVWARDNRRRLHLPYAWAVTGLLLAGTTSAIWAQTPGGAGRSAPAMVQDILMFAWAAAIATAAADGRVRRVLARVWAASAMIWSFVLVVGVVAGIPFLAGTTERDGTRAALTFGDPNLAASYFVISAFVVAATRYPRRRSLRWPGLVLILAALGLTGSNGGMLSLATGIAVGGVVVLYRRRGPVTTLGVIAVGVLGVTALTATVSLADLRAKAKQSGPVADASVGHSDESELTRSVLLDEVLGLAQTGPLTGRGPATTEVSLRQQAAPYVKEAHSDYTAVLAERGPLGAVSLMLLVGSVAARLTRRRTGAGDDEDADADADEAVPAPGWLAGAAAAVLLSGAFYEVLHFRHVWALFGLIAAAHAGQWISPRTSTATSRAT